MVLFGAHARFVNIYRTKPLLNCLTKWRSLGRKKKKTEQAINIFLFTKWGQTHPLQETMVWVRFFLKYGCFCEDRECISGTGFTAKVSSGPI